MCIVVSALPQENHLTHVPQAYLPVTGDLDYVSKLRFHLTGKDCQSLHASLFSFVTWEQYLKYIVKIQCGKKKKLMSVCVFL